MSTYNEQLQHIWHAYEKDHDGVPATPREVVAWGLARGLLESPQIDPLAVLADDMARALREEYKMDKSGRRYRVNHAIRITRDGIQMSLWGELETAPREHMVKAFAQRRRQIIGDCVQLKTDVGAYNGMHKDNEPIQLELDFTNDVAEVLGDEAA